MLRTGVDYVESVRDGRRVWVLGEGLVEDITTHPATKPMVDVYATWYDQHFDPEWQKTLLSPAGEGEGAGYPLAFLTPRSADRSPAHGPLFRFDAFLDRG